MEVDNIKENKELEENIEKETKQEPAKRGRPKKIELPEVSEINDIISVEEVKDDELKSETTIISEDAESKDNLVQENKEPENQKISKAESNTESTTKGYYVARHKFRKYDNVYLVHFSGKTEENLFNLINEKYKFRPLKATIKEVIINSDESISYKVNECQGCFVEKLLTKTLEECQRICDLKNSN